MKRRPKLTLAALAVSTAALVAALAMAIPALAHHGSEGFGGDPAGTIASFDQESGVLTVNLAEGGSVSGLVTHWTWIDCGGDRWGGHHGGDSHHFRSFRHDDGGWHHWGDPSCDSSDLVSGATVEDAVVGLADGKAFFAKVDLEAPPETTTSR